MTLNDVLSSEVFDSVVRTGFRQSPLKLDRQVSGWKDTGSEDAEGLVIGRSALFREDDSRDQDSEPHMSRRSGMSLIRAVRHGSEDVSISGPFNEEVSAFKACEVDCGSGYTR